MAELVEESIAAPHAPTIFWIGCADGRLSESLIIPDKQIFAQRNIANQFHPDDDNAMASLAFAVTSLTTITQIMVVGHTGCAGVRACYESGLGKPPTLEPVIWRWLKRLRVLAASLVAKGHSEREIINDNVRVQVANIYAALKTLPPPGRKLTLSGQVFNLSSLKLEKIMEDISFP